MIPPRTDQGQTGLSIGTQYRCIVREDFEEERSASTISEPRRSRYEGAVNSLGRSEQLAGQANGRQGLVMLG
jgi:hypothetical protein